MSMFYCMDDLNKEIEALKDPKYDFNQEKVLRLFEVIASELEEVELSFNELGEMNADLTEENEELYFRIRGLENDIENMV